MLVKKRLTSIRFFYESRPALFFSMPAVLSEGEKTWRGVRVGTPEGIEPERGSVCCRGKERFRRRAYLKALRRVRSKVDAGKRRGSWPGPDPAPGLQRGFVTA